MAEEKKKKVSKKKDQKNIMIAKKDFVIHQNSYHRDIKKDEDVSDVPEHFHVNLRIEGVL